ncbi:hypothetical protein EVAR_18863_1 [Eumeta japonica]|uniref:Uncharacterized protein n=1 Tax=Eumeta variegata TaxID=151549 RepID=A0A4C1UN20_EUMVA|nr:hypothetical protein EVAR_18863_1 [Eumeta japonica]
MRSKEVLYPRPFPTPVPTSMPAPTPTLKPDLSSTSSVVKSSDVVGPSLRHISLQQPIVAGLYGSRFGLELDDGLGPIPESFLVSIRPSFKRILNFIYIIYKFLERISASLRNESGEQSSEAARGYGELAVGKMIYIVCVAAGGGRRAGAGGGGGAAAAGGRWPPRPHFLLLILGGARDGRADRHIYPGGRRPPDIKPYYNDACLVNTAAH